MADQLIYLPDGRVVRRPYDLEDDQIEQFKLDFATKFPIAMPEEDIIETPLSTEPSYQPLSPQALAQIPPKLRLPHEYKEGDPFLEQVKAGAASTIQGMQTTFDRELGLKNLAALKAELDEVESEYNELKLKEESGTLLDEDRERLQELHIKIYGTQKPSGIPEMFPGQPISSTMISMEEKSRKGLKPYLDELHTNFRQTEKISEEAEVSDAFRWIMEQSHGEPGLRKGVKKAFSTFWNDLDRSQKGDFMGDLLGRSAVATSAILATSFGVGGILRKAKAIPQIIGQIGAVSPVSGGIEYSHSIHEYLKSKGMDTSNLDSIAEFVNDPEMMEEANDYALKRGAIIGIVDGVTGGIATRIIAPATITRSHRSVMPFLKKAEGVPMSTPTRYGINFLAQTPLQTTLPAGAEYFAQLATLEEGQKISYGEVLAEALGEFAFVPADMALGSISAGVSYMSPNHIKQEAFSDVIEQVQNTKQQARDVGLGDLAGRLETGEVIRGEATVRTPVGTPLFDTGIMNFENALPLFLDSPDISITANNDADIIAPNQFVVRPDGQGGFEIIDTFSQKIGESYETKTEAGGTAGALNVVYGAAYANLLKSEYATMQGLDVDEDTGGFASKLGNKMLNPYVGQLELDEIRENILNFKPAAYERLINAIGEDATGVDPISIINDLSKKDFDALMNRKAQLTNPNVPKNVTAKMFENLKKRINVEVNVNSNAFKSLALKLTGEPNFNKMSNPQKRLVYAFLTSLPAHEGATISLPDFSARPYTTEEYNQVVDSLNAGNLPTLTTIANALSLNPQDVSAKRVATRLREDLISAGIVNKRGTKYKFNKNGDWSLLRAQQVANATDPQIQEEQEEIEKFRASSVEELNKMGLNDIAVKLDTAIQQRQGQTNPDAEGVFDPVWKEILLALGKAKEGTTSEAEVLTNLNRILGHESMHATRRLDLFSQTEWNNLVNYIMNTPVSDKVLGEIIGTENVDAMKEVYPTSLGKNPTYFEAIDFRYNTMEGLNQNIDTIQEEAVALLYENYLDQKKKVVGQPRAMLERTKKFFTAINNGLNDAGYQTYEGIFDKLVSGRIGERGRTDQSRKPITIHREDSQGRPAGTYEVQPRAVRTPRILQGEVGFLQAGTGIGNIDSDDHIPEEADAEIPIESRPLQDAPNLKFKLAEVQLRPTSVTADFISNARQQDYGNDITQIALAILDQTIADDARMTRNYGRRLSAEEIKDAEQQLYYYSQENLKQIGYPDHSQQITLYGVGNVKRLNALTPSLIEAQSIANGITEPPFSILGDRAVITEYRVPRSRVVLTSDVMFAMRPPAWLESGSNFFMIGNNSLIGGTEIAYEPQTPTVRVIQREFNSGSPVRPPVAPRKPFPRMKYKLSGLTGDLFEVDAKSRYDEFGLPFGSEIYKDVFNVFDQAPNRWQQSLDRLRKITDNPELTKDQVDRAAREILDITQVSLDAFPQQIRVYRGGIQGGAVLQSDEVVPVTLAPEVAKAFAYRRRDKTGRFSLQSWLIDKSEVLINIDAFQPLGYWENELLVDADGLRIAQETAEAQGNLDYVDYTAPATLDRVRDLVTKNETAPSIFPVDKTLASFSFPFNFFPEASASETLLHEMGEPALSGVPEYAERERTVPRNTYRFPYGEDFAEYMAQPEEKRRGKWLTDRLKQYPTPAHMVGQKVKYKLAYPTTDQEFIESKENLLELLESGTSVNDLMEHPAIVEGERRMMAIPETIDKYLQRYGENWVLNPSYLNNREFVINGKKVKGVKNVIDATIKKAESYARGTVGNNKIAWYFLGPSASGKSHFAEAVARDKNLAIIDNDDVKRFIPEYGDGVGANAVHREASVLSRLATKEMLRRNKDILIPKVGGVSKRSQVLDDVRNLKELGYTVNITLVEVTEPISQDRAYLRFTQTGRLVPPSYIADVGNTPTDTYHRVKYITDDGFAWIDNNGNERQEIIREDTGILPASIGRERGTVGQRIRETSDSPVQEVVSEALSETRAVSIAEAIEGAKGINERMVAAGLVPKFNLNASADAIYIAYRTELKKPEADIIPQSLRTKYSLKSPGKWKPDPTLDRLISKTTIRDKMVDKTAGEIILEVAKGIDEDYIREQLVDRHARFETVKLQANQVRGIKEEMVRADVDLTSALMLSDRAGEIFKASLMEGIPVYDEAATGGKGYIRVETVSPIDGKPTPGPLQIFRNMFGDRDKMFAFAAVRTAKREKRFNDEGKPVKTTAQDRKDAEAALEKYDWLKEASEAYDRWDQHVVQFLVDTGVLDAKTAKIWTASSDYFPFYRMIGVDKYGKQLTRGPNIFKGLSLGKNIFVKAKGSKDKDIVDPVTGIAENLRAAITLGMKNVAANRAIRDLLELGPDFAEQVPNNSSGIDIVKIRVGGQLKSFRIADPQILEAFMNFEGGMNTFSGFMFSLLRVPKEAVSALITRTPDFWVRQVVRDSVSAWSLLGGRWLPLLSSVGNWVRIWAGLIAARLPFGLDVDIMPEGFHKLRLAGVIAGYDNVVKDIDRTDKLVKSAYRQAGITNRSTPKAIAMVPFDIIRGVWEFLGQGTLSSDAATRLAVYEDILRETGNEAEAIYQAMEVLNFTRRGKNTFMQLMAISVPFQNPRLQGVDVFYRGITGKYGKRGLTRNQKIAATAMRFGALMALTPIYWLAVKDSDEYKEATEEVRDNYWIVPGSKTFTGETIGVPTPFEVGIAVKTVPENIIRYFANEQTSEDFWESMKRTMGSAVAINPFQAPLIKSITEWWTNYNFFTGQPVVPHNMLSLDKELQYRPSTNNLFVKIGQETGMSPLKLENTWKGLTGTYGAWFATWLDGLLRENLDLPTRQAMRIDERPLIGSLLLPPEMRGQETEFYKLRETVTNLIKTINEMEKRTLESDDPFAFNLSMEYQRTYKELLTSLNTELGETADLLSATRTREANIRFSRELDAKEKAEELEIIQSVRNDLLRGISEKRIFIEEEIESEIRP